MIRDEIDGVGVKAITRAEYMRQVYRAAAVLFVIEVVVDLTLRFAYQFRTWNWYGAAFGLNVLLGRWVINADLKRRGLSRSGPTVAVWGKLGAAPAGEVAPAAVEVRRPRDGLLALSVVCLAASPPGMALGIGLVTQRTAPLESGAAWATRVGALGLAILLAGALGVAGIWLLKKAVTPRRCYRADASGLTDFLKDQFIAWPDVATCHVTTRHDALGDPTGATHELIGWHGDILLKLKLDWLAARDRDRLLAFIHDRLPKPVKDDFDGDEL